MFIEIHMMRLLCVWEPQNMGASCWRWPVVKVLFKESHPFLKGSNWREFKEKFLALCTLESPCPVFWLGNQKKKTSWSGRAEVTDLLLCWHQPNVLILGARGHQLFWDFVAFSSTTLEGWAWSSGFQSGFTWPCT